MRNFNEYLNEQLQNPEFRREYEALEETYSAEQVAIDADNATTDAAFRKLLKCLKTADTIEELNACTPIVLTLIPDAAAMIGYDQKHWAHQYDLWNHCLHTVLNLPRGLDDDMLYLAALLHDIGKPDCQSFNKHRGGGYANYYGHLHRSMEIVRDDVIPALAANGIVFSPKEKKRLLYYVEYHDDYVTLNEKCLVRHSEIADVNEFYNLMLLQIADAKAHIMLPAIEKRIRICQALLDLLKVRDISCIGCQI